MINLSSSFTKSLTESLENQDLKNIEKVKLSSEDGLNKINLKYKIEKLFKLIINFSLENNNSEASATKDELEALKNAIKIRVQLYDAKHSGIAGKIYNFFRKISNGDIHKYSQTLLGQIDQKLAHIQAQKLEKNLQNQWASIAPDQNSLATDYSLVIIPSLNQNQQPKFGEINQLVQKFNSNVQKICDNQLTFEVVQSLKQIKSEAKLLSKDPSLTEEAKSTLDSINTQYKNLVQTIEVLRTLKEFSTEMKEGVSSAYKGAYVKKTPFEKYGKFLQENIEETADFRILGSLAKQLKTEYSNYKAGLQSQWKEKWNAVREKMWHASVEGASLINAKKQISYITGANSASLPLILKTPQLAKSLVNKPSLVPTGQLLRHNIVPLSGELSMGITADGINQKALSGIGFHGLDTCVGYATAKTFKFNTEVEIEKILKSKIDSEKEAYFAIPKLRVAVLRLLLTGSAEDKYPLLKQHLQTLIDKIPDSSSLKRDWKQTAYLVGKGCDNIPLSKTPPQPLSRGQIVAIPRSDSNELHYGMIQEISPNGDYTVLVDRKGSLKVVKESEMRFPDEKKLSKQVVSTLTSNELHHFQQKLANSKEHLKQILDLFGTVKSASFSKQDYSLIEESFPLVWASFNLDANIRVRGVEGEKAYAGTAALGDDVQVAFTKKENVKQLQTLLNAYGVKVMSFEAAYYVLGNKYK